ncbi:conserved hypothetical protein (putative transposase or invertase) [Anaerovibrio lipolyticus DSM 3074]|uniref:PD-(D/E)XK nuclease family transposase n=1 Tax=Anaerovibrio lipolyticus DSM 3074 TaxID=1120997 RepID=A0A1M6BFC5_9FIRM|nr:Rpn family recombination-promoting nuclease/putative transposase [Anaerovibrio lipolyticus]SHI47415.1 conserved hypothetical protein (putative transposase or invertase) [Anaerovibrio lipolyticus DSM 3074]
MEDKEILSTQFEPWEKATITNAVMFRLVMEKPGLCKKLLERLLNITISKMEIPEFEKDFREGMVSRGIRLDIYIEDADGTAIDIEMQAVTKKKEELGKRTRYYQSVMDHNLLAKGQHYTKLRKSYIIFICTFDPYGAGLPRYTFSNLCVSDNTLELCDEAYKIFFNASAVNMDNITKDQRAFLKYVNGGSADDDFTRELDSTVKEYRADERKKATYMTFQQEIMEIEARGEARGEVKGALKMAVQTVRNFMSKNPEMDVNTVMDELSYEGKLREQILKHIVQ